MKSCKIAIINHDNDFVTVWRKILEIFFMSIEWRENTKIVNKDNKENLANIFNLLIPGIYSIFQKNFDIIGCLNVQNYLKLTSDKILIDEEIDEYLERSNSGIYILYINFYENRLSYVIDARM